MWFIHIVECYSAIKRNIILMCATTWLNCKSVSQMKEGRHKRLHNTYWMIPCTSQNYRDRKQVSGCQGLEVEGANWRQKDRVDIWGLIEIVHILFVVVVMWLYTFIKTHRTILLKLENFILCKSNKPGFLQSKGH